MCIRDRYVRDDGKKYLPNFKLAKLGYHLKKYDCGVKYDMSSESDLPLFRTAEVYLILAEAMARLNDLSGSVEVLNQLREKRIKGSEAVLPEPATQREMMQEIINERRKELLFGFSRFWDLKRFNTEADYAKTITRTFPLVTTTVEQKIYTLKPDSRLYIIPFPVAAREKNPNLTLNTNE